MVRLGERDHRARVRVSVVVSVKGVSPEGAAEFDNSGSQNKRCLGMVSPGRIKKFDNPGSALSLRATCLGS